jgi:hypothetical protein
MCTSGQASPGYDWRVKREIWGREHINRSICTKVKTEKKAFVMGKYKIPPSLIPLC